MIRFVPGLVGALTAFAALEVTGLLGVSSLTARAFVFLAAYLAVAVAVDLSMKRYGTGAGGSR